MKRICKVHPDWLVPYLDKLLSDISKIDQASTQWTLAQLFLWLENEMTQAQKDRAIEVMKHNLENSNDWIVQNNTIETLAMWSKDNASLKTWLLPRLHRFEKSDRKSVSGRAKKMLTMLSSN